MSARDERSVARAPDAALIEASHSRRDFLKSLGGGIAIFFGLDGGIASVARGEASAARGTVPTDFNAFLRIAPTGRVTCMTGKIEMGQGPITSLPQMLADELDVPFDDVDIIMGDTDLCPWDRGTWGSRTTRFFGMTLRAAAAEARAVLVELASVSLEVPVSRLAVADGVVFDTTNESRRVSFAALAKGEPIARDLSVKPTLKDVSDFRVMGQPKLRRDSLEKVTGRAKYAGDVRLPDMLYAKILRPPAHGASLKSVDSSGARKIPGVRVVDVQGLVAVLHELPDVAEEALGRVEAEFDTPHPTVTHETIHEHLERAAPRGSVVSEGGDVRRGRKLASRSFSTTFYDSYVAHAPMETHTALATVERGKCTVWASTQNPFGARDKVARALRMKPEKVRVITPFVGGAFGGKTVNTQAVEAALLAKAAGRPVQVMRSREEEFFYDTFHPAAVVRIRSGVDDASRMTLWDYEVLFAGPRGAEHFYSIPHHRTRTRGGHGRAHPFATGAWRAPGNNTNTFARESQIDIMAAALGQDPIAFRLKHLSDRRMRRVLEAAARRFGWEPRAAPSGRGLGVACAIDAGTYVAAIAEVEVDTGTGYVQPKRVLCAQDMGIVINPQGATLQVEGCITMGLGYALTEEVHFRDGKVLDTNFDRYEIPRFSSVPEIETLLIEANDIPPQGGGEPAIVVVGAIIANAIFDATGARLTRMPMTPDRVKAAIAQI